MNHHSKKILSYLLTAIVVIAAAIWVGSRFISATLSSPITPLFADR